MTASPLSPARSSYTYGYLICLTGTLFLSSTAVFIRYLINTYQMPSLLLAFWRDALVFAGLGFAFWIAWPEQLKPGRGQWGFLFLYGLELAVFNGLWTLSVALNGAAVSTVLAYSSAAFTTLLGWKLFGERITRVKVMAVILSLTGTVLVSGAYSLTLWTANSTGVVTGVLSGLAYAVYSLLGRGAALRSINPWTTLFYTFGVAAAVLLVLNAAFTGLPQLGASAELFWLGQDLAGWGVLVVLALVPTIGGFGLYTASMVYLPASVANLIATLEPAITAGLAYLFLNERLLAPQLIGGLLIVTGVAALRLGEGRS